MSKIGLLGTTTLAAVMIVGAVRAADMPVKTPMAPIYPAPVNWTGFYIGAHVGEGWSTKTWSDPCFFPIGSSCSAADATQTLGFVGSYDLSGFLGGGQIGYNWQSGWAVFGVEADASWTAIKGEGQIGSISSGKSKIDALGTITGRIGGAVDRALIYVKAGGAWARETHTNERQLADFSFASSSSSQTRWGWIGGAGVEYAFAPNWSGRIEYNYFDFGKHTSSFVFPVSFDVDIRQTLHMVKVGLNYRFGGPIGASY